MVAIAVLNLKLKTLQEPIWQLRIVQPEQVDSGRDAISSKIGFKAVR